MPLLRIKLLALPKNTYVSRYSFLKRSVFKILGLPLLDISTIDNSEKTNHNFAANQLNRNV